jgi:hypothetical protein
MSRDVWNERPVTFAEFSIRDGRPLDDAFAIDGEQGSYQLLVLSLRYADTGLPVFAAVDEIFALPFKHRATLGRLAAKAGFVNGLRLTDPDAQTPPGNGPDTEAAAGPPH